MFIPVCKVRDQQQDCRRYKYITLLSVVTYLSDDGKRRKRKQIEFNLVGSTWTPVAETWYIYEGMTVIQERSNSNVPTVHDTRGLDLSGSLGGAGGIGGLLTRSSGYNTSTGAWSTHDYEHADGSGNITMLISNSTTPTIRAQYEYDPFGRIQTQSGTLATSNTQRFSSKEQIGTSPLSYYGYRFYHAETQRWINRDPIEENGGLNLYGFVGNRPIDRADAYGLDVYYMVYYDQSSEHIPGFNHEVILAGNLDDGFVLFEPDRNNTRWNTPGSPQPTTCRTSRFPINSWLFKQIPILTWALDDPQQSIVLRFPTGGFMGIGSGPADVIETPNLLPGFGNHMISSTPEQDERIIDYFTYEDRGPRLFGIGYCFYNCGLWADHFMETTRNMLPFDR